MLATEHSWACSNHCERPGEDEQRLIDRRSEVVVLGEVCDAEADYSYDDFALVRLDDDYYLLNTSGCSCPSPSETWSVQIGPVSLDGMEAALRREETSGRAYGVTHRQFDEFLEMIASARAEVRGVCL